MLPSQLKERQGNISRIGPDGHSAVCKGLFKKESDISFFEGAKVVTGRGETGVIQVCTRVGMGWVGGTGGEKESNKSFFEGAKVVTEGGETGVIQVCVLGGGCQLGVVNSESRACKHMGMLSCQTESTSTFYRIHFGTGWHYGTV